ncbi:hypothetical protein, partial [Mycobacterium sp. 1274756.6]|uniref:phage shock envelope stress response protein PspM n=1 Tax=Mycobacterium sp. 1274756.6 TaxID=1834076 RepID=UPI000A95276F
CPAPRSSPATIAGPYCPSGFSGSRARLLRQRRRALRWGLLAAGASLFWALLTALLASWATPVWVLIITSVIAAAAVVPATLLLLRFRWLRSVPLPPARTVTARRLPPPDSAARSAMSALAASERGLFSLIGVMERGNLLPRTEIEELKTVATDTATTMAATADEVVSMERAMTFTPQSRTHLVPTINAFTAQLGGGVRQYNAMVTAAAQLVSAANGGTAHGSPMGDQRYRRELLGATDRLQGWAQAFDELAAPHRA